MNKWMISFLFFALACVGCSDDESNTDKDAQISQEMLEKIEAVYGNASLDAQTVTTVNQLAILTSICATEPKWGPITVTPAKLNGEEVTLLTMGGMEQTEGRATTIEESRLATMGEPNDYLNAVLKLFREGTIPEGKPVLACGISLGGMIAQQLLSCEEVMVKYTFCGVITFGSPLNVPLNRKGVKVVRFVDEHDKVPQLGEMMLRTGMVQTGLTKEELKAKIAQMDAQEKIVRESKYNGLIETHALSYIEDSCWLGFDFMGDTSMSNTLETLATLTFYEAPKLKK